MPGERSVCEIVVAAYHSMMATGERCARDALHARALPSPEALANGPKGRALGAGLQRSTGCATPSTIFWFAAAPPLRQQLRTISNAASHRRTAPVRCECQMRNECRQAGLAERINRIVGLQAPA